MIHESGLDDVGDSIGPFLEGYGCDDVLIKACGTAVMQCANGNRSNTRSYEVQPEAVKLKQGIVSLSSVLSDQSEAEIDANRYMWGQDK